MRYATEQVSVMSAISANHLRKKQNILPLNSDSLTILSSLISGELFYSNAFSVFITSAYRESDETDVLFYVYTIN